MGKEERGELPYQEEGGPVFVFPGSILLQRTRGSAIS
jgi:hypothetical protein